MARVFRLELFLSDTYLPKKLQYNTGRYALMLACSIYHLLILQAARERALEARAKRRYETDRECVMAELAAKGEDVSIGLEQRVEAYALAREERVETLIKQITDKHRSFLEQAAS